MTSHKEINDLPPAPLYGIDNIQSLIAPSVSSYCNWGNNSVNIKAEINFPDFVYDVENYKAIRLSRFIEKDNTFDTPKLNISQFDGCPHFYGRIYWKGFIFELHQEITEEFLTEGKATGGDWAGFKIGEYTQRFLSKESLTNAFNKIKEKMTND